MGAEVNNQDESHMNVSDFNRIVIRLSNGFHVRHWLNFFGTEDNHHLAISIFNIGNGGICEVIKCDALLKRGFSLREDGIYTIKKSPRHIE